MENFYNFSSKATIRKLESSTEGLSPEQAMLRLKENGKNELDEGRKKSFLTRFFEQLKDVMIIVLIVAALVTGVIAVIKSDYSELIDGGLILLIVLINAFIGLAQESKAEEALEALKETNKPLARVVRNGEVRKINSNEIVVGDIVLFETGDTVPADIRILESASLKIEEAALTGESLPNEKSSQIIRGTVPLGDRYNMAYASGNVVYGRGRGIVVATGMNTEVGKIAQMLTRTEQQQTPLQKQLARTAKVLSIAILIIAACIFAVSIIKAKSFNIEVMLQAFMTAVAIAVAAIPEGLPAVVTIVLAVGVQQMSRRNAIIRNLPAVETLGCCQVICSDKTGTLTLNKMTVTELYTHAKGRFLGAEGSMEDKAMQNLFMGMVLCNDTIIKSNKELLGDPTETALIAYARQIDKDIINWPKENPRIDERPFDSKRKLMSTINKTREGNIAFIKGATDILLDKCKYIQEGNVIREITESDIKEILESNLQMARNALRVLAIAIKKNDFDTQNLEEDMIFVGLVGMIDPPRPEVKEAVQKCKKAGMTPIMITGDHIDTAKAIAKEINILDSDTNIVITGQELDNLSDEEFSKNLSQYRVFARVSPENKVRIVDAYKDSNLVVAMTGDGVNDAPSIKRADIGIGMGITGTDVSKGVADMVLADDNFATIINAVEEGRKAYSNIKKAIQFLLSANIAEVLCLFIITLFMPPQVRFLTPVMILWVNLVTDALPALALGMEKAEDNVMGQRPRQQGQSLFVGQTGKDIIIQGLFQTILVLFSFFIGYFVFEDHSQMSNGISMTMAFISLCMIQLFHSYNLRSQTESLFRSNPLSNGFLNVSFLIGTLLLIMVIIFPFMRLAFGTVVLSPLPLIISLGLAILIIPLVEVQKVIENKIYRKRKQ